MAAAVRVGWDDDTVVAAWPGLAPLDGDRRADAAVVGLGGSGLAAVAALVQRGLSVVGVDAGRVGAGAAGRNGGFLLGGPAMFAHRAIAAWGAETAIALYRATLGELDRLAAQLGPSVIRRTGSIRLAGLPGLAGAARDEAEEADRAAELADCAAHAAALRAHGIAVQDYDGPLGRGLFLPDDAAMQPARRVLALAGGLRGRAVLHEQTRVRAIGPGRVLTDHGSISAAVVIVAVDGGLELLLPQLAGRVRTARLQMLAGVPERPIPPGRLPCPVYGRWGYDYAQLEPVEPAGRSGPVGSAGAVRAVGSPGPAAPFVRIFAGGGRDRFERDEWTTSSAPTAAVQAHIDQVASRMAGVPVRATHRWGASVGFTADGRALCTVVDDGVVAIGGYSGTGNLVGSLAARAAVELALDGTAPPSYFAS